jgi:hypothetical protein
MQQSNQGAETGSQQSLPAMLNNQQIVDEAVARFFYRAGVSVASNTNY